MTARRIEYPGATVARLVLDMTDPATFPGAFTFACEQCGQTAAAPDGAQPPARILCDPCLELDRAPQGAQDPLFQSAPAQLAGQTFLSIPETGLRADR